MSFLSTDQGYKALRPVEQCLAEGFSSDDKGIPISKSQEISTWRVAVNIINYMEGIGFLALPYALHEGGITALIGLAVVPFIMGYSAYLLADCLEDEDVSGERKRVRWTYQDIGMACWPPFEHIVWAFVTLNLYIGICSLLVLCGSLMSQQFSQVPITQSQWACIGTALVFPMTFVKQLSRIAWISLFGIIALIVSACITFGYEFQEVAHWDLHSLLFWDTRGVFVSLSIVIGSYGIHDGIVAMAVEVSKLHKLKIALTWSYLFSAIFKIVFAVSGFLTYSNNTNEVLLNNLPAGILVNVIAALFVLNVLITYPLLVLVLLKNLEELGIYVKLTNTTPPRVCFVVLRILVVLAVLGFSVGMPHFALVSALDGSFFYVIALVFPGLFHLCLKYKHLSKLQVLTDVGLIVLGVIGMCFGLITTIMSFVAII